MAYERKNFQSGQVLKASDLNDMEDAIAEFDETRESVQEMMDEMEQSGAIGKSAYAYAVEGGYTGTEAEFGKKLAQEYPSRLANPYRLTFQGAATGSYDGSAALTVKIPEGSENGVPDCTEADYGKFLTVDYNGNASWKTVTNAEEETY